MEKLDIAIIKSTAENLTKLNDSIYFEIEKDGYHNLATITAEGLKTSIFIFNNLKNKEHLQNLINGYAYVNKTSIYFGKIERTDEYTATELSGKPKRLKILVDNGDTYSLPIVAKIHLKL